MKSVNYYGNTIKNHMESMKRYEILAKDMHHEKTKTTECQF